MSSFQQWAPLEPQIWPRNTLHTPFYMCCKACTYFEIRVNCRSFHFEDFMTAPDLGGNKQWKVTKLRYATNLVSTTEKSEPLDAVLTLNGAHSHRTHKASGGNGAEWTWSEGRLHCESVASWSAQTSELHFLCLCEPILQEKQIWITHHFLNSLQPRRVHATQIQVDPAA